MRKTFLFLFCGLLATRSLAQTVTLNQHKAALKNLFVDIHRQTGIYFVYSSEDLSDTHPVDIHVTEATLETTLGICFAGQPLDYTIDHNTIVIQKRLNIPLGVISVNGHIVGEDGDPVLHASVHIQGTDTYTETDETGAFSFESIASKSVLLITHIGYESLRVPVSGKSVLTILMKRASSKLDEIQVIGYGTTTHRLNTGSVSTVKSEEIEKQPITDPLSALEGRVAGLTVIQNSGVTGSSFQVLIRGRNSLTSGTNPLYIVDGVPFASASLGSPYSGIIQNGDPLSSIDPASIASIDILKDADATAIYGSRGANGVILITTKKGAVGKTHVELTAYTGIMKLTQPMKLLGTKDYLAMRHQAFTNDGETPDASNAPDLTLWDTTQSTDWQKVLLGNTGQINDGHISLSGGDSGTHFRTGGGYHRETSVFPGSFADQKASGNASLDHHSSDNRFFIQLSGSYLIEKNHLPSFDATYQALSTPPDAPSLYDSAGQLNWAHSSWVNPVRYSRQLFEANTENTLANAIISYQLLNGIELKLTGGYTRMHFNELSTYPLASNDPAWGISTGSSIFGENSTATWILEPQINLNRKMATGHLQLTVGATLQSSGQKSQTLLANGYTNDALLENISGAASITLTGAQDVQYRYAAVFARARYDLRQEWMIDLTGRRDGSSRFGPGRQFADFGAAGVAWIFSQRPFFQTHVRSLSYGKLRSSWGITGNDQIGDYQFLSTYSATQFPYQNTGGLYPNNLSNPDFGWEKDTKWEMAVETGWWHNRLLFNVSYYRNRSSNQLIGYSLPLITGFASIVANLPAIIQNAGWEVEMTSRNLTSRYFTWTTTLNLTVPQDKLVAFPALATSAYATTYVIGQSLNVHQLFHVAGVDPATGTYQFIDHTGKPTVNPLYPDDLVTHKNVRQQFYGGLSNNFQTGHWKLDIFFQFVNQTGRNYLSVLPGPGTLSNQPQSVIKRWQHPGDQSAIQQYSQDYGSIANAVYGNLYSSDLSIGDASFVSLKNVSLSYLFAIKSHGKPTTQTLKCFVSGQNLHHFDHYKGLSPQTQSFTNLPLLTTVTGGFQIQF